MSFEEPAKRSVWILDVDDCLYPIDNKKNPGKPGLHQRIKHSIIQNWNTHASQPLKEALGRYIVVAATQFPEAAAIDHLALKPQDLKIVFPYMLMAIKDVAPESVLEWLDKFYGDLYEECLAADPVLVEAIRTARQAGIRVVFYTNGPSHPEAGKDAHVQRVLRALGFSEAEIDVQKEQTQDLLMSEADGFAKPQQQSMQIVLERFGIHPAEALMADDSIPNIVTARQAGVFPLWTWTSAKAPSAKDVELARSIGAMRVSDTGVALLQIAHARLIQINPAPIPFPDA